MKFLRAVVVVVVVSLLLLVDEFSTCAASCPGPVDDEAPAAVKQRRAHPRWAAWPHAARMRCLHMPSASTALVEKKYMWPAARADTMTSARASTSRDI